MGFLDNSGDIILDAVLTDHGRKVLAKGDGSFQITKFALCDEEIDYSLYNKTHPSGSAYYDLEILQTPILEAFTDNGASMKTVLQTYTNLELLFLPVLRLNQTKRQNQMATEGTFYCAVNSETEDNDGSPTTKTGVGRESDGTERQGFIFGQSLVGAIIKVDEGLDTTEISPKRKIDESLRENSYIIQMDNRLGTIVSPSTGAPKTPDYIDDDSIAYYTVDLGSDYVSLITDDTNSPSQVILGPRGTSLQFRVQSSMDLNTSNYLFNQLGSTVSLPNRGKTNTTCYYIDTNIKISGIKTGVNINVPLRYVRI